MHVTYSVSKSRKQWDWSSWQASVWFKTDWTALVDSSKSQFFGSSLQRDVCHACALQFFSSITSKAFLFVRLTLMFFFFFCFVKWVWVKYAKHWKVKQRLTGDVLRVRRNLSWHCYGQCVGWLSKVIFFCCCCCCLCVCLCVRACVSGRGRH